MKIVLNANTPKRRLVAVLGVNKSGAYFPKAWGGSVYLAQNGIIGDISPESLEELLEAIPDRTPVYEGDEIIMKF